MGCVASSVDASAPVTASEFRCKYVLGGKVGVGSFAQVHLAQRRLSSTSSPIVAVKIQTWHNESSGKSSEDLRKKICRKLLTETCLWSRVGGHANCVQLYEHFFEDDLCYMVMEKCSRDLFTHIKGYGMVTEASLADVFAQMLQGIAHIHAANIVHRDLKPDNFVVGGRDYSTVKLGDFGLAAFVPEGGTAKGVCGTTPYMCPEIFIHKECDLKADVWSFGVIAYILLCGKWPYDGADNHFMRRAIVKGPSPEFRKLPSITLSARLFLFTLLERDPQSRPTVESVLNTDAFLKSTCKAQRQLEPMVLTAEEIASYSPSLKQTSHIDRLLRKGVTSNSKVLAQSHIDAIIGASPEEIEKVVEAILPSKWSEGDCDNDIEPSISKSTTIASSDNMSSISIP